jgi:hypothetical protein
MASLVWKLTHPRSWPTTDAVVESCEWVRYHDHLGGNSGHYVVKFNYQAGDRRETHAGEFCHQGTEHIAPYYAGEHLAMQYDPNRPSRYHFSGASSNYEKLEAIVVITGFALLAIYALYVF